MLLEPMVPTAGSYSRRVESLLRPPILFGLREPRDQSPDGDLAAYARAVSLGATGIAATAWSTADGVVVLRDSGSLGGPLRRRPVRAVSRAALPAAVPTLEALYDACGSGIDVALDVADHDTARAAISVVEAVAGAPGVRRLWLVHPDRELLGEWRQEWSGVRLVNRAHLRALRHGSERRAAQLAEAGIDAILLPSIEWSGGLTTLFHRFDRLAFASHARHDHVLRELARIGIDAVTSDKVERMVAALGARRA